MGKNMHIQEETLTLKHIMKWIQESFAPSYQSEIETYLSQSTDHADLEQRMRGLARRGML
jgi:hypothetical protein